MASFYENTLSELIERILKLPLKCWKGGVTTKSGSTTTLVDSKRVEPDDYFQNTTPISVIHMVATTDGQAPVGEEGTASDWVLGTTTMTFSPALSVAVDTNDEYIVLKEYAWAEIKEAINTAIDAVASRALIEKVDETIEVQDDTYEYALPDGFIYIYRVTQSNDDGDYLQPIPPDHYTILRGGEKPKLKFKAFPAEGEPDDWYYGGLWVEEYLSDGQKLKIEGLARQPIMDKEQDICYLDPDYIVYQAAAYLHAARIRSPANEPDDHRTQYEICQRIADSRLAVMQMRLPANAKRVTN